MLSPRSPRLAKATRPWPSCGFRCTVCRSRLTDYVVEDDAPRAEGKAVAHGCLPRGAVSVANHGIGPRLQPFYEPGHPPLRTVVRRPAPWSVTSASRRLCHASAVVAGGDRDAHLRLDRGHSLGQPLLRLVHDTNTASSRAPRAKRAIPRQSSPRRSVPPRDRRACRTRRECRDLRAVRIEIRPHHGIHPSGE